MTQSDARAHAREIRDQFTQQAQGFARSPALHADEILALMTQAAALDERATAIDLACGPGSVACAFAARAARVVGLDATPAMLDQACKLAERRGLANVEWREGGVYDAPFPDGAFDAVACRFAFHHFENPARAFAEMVRLAAPGGRIVLCDAVVHDDPAKAAAFNAMERRRDPSTVAFLAFDQLTRLFVAAGLGAPRTQWFQVVYSAADLTRGSFPADGDRAALQALLEGSVEGDTLGMNATRTAEGVTLAYRAVVLSAVKSG
jgi:ubiquinone/menaquinone biosynthesis C-methylase UbiE